MKYRILIVEDEELIARGLASALASWGYDARICADFGRIAEEYAAIDPHLTLLDLKLPHTDGFTVCGQIRRISHAPIVFLSSAGDDMNIVTAMTLGADDFIMKPFEMAVLRAKLAAILRRSYDFAQMPATLDVCGAQLSRTDAKLTFNAETLTLTRNEYRILLTLFERAGQVVSRERLMEALWETDCFVDENTLSVNIARLRKKLESIGLAELIVTRKGMGYIVSGE